MFGQQLQCATAQLNVPTARQRAVAAPSHGVERDFASRPCVPWSNRVTVKTPPPIRRRSCGVREDPGARVRDVRTVSVASSTSNSASLYS